MAKEPKPPSFAQRRQEALKALKDYQTSGRMPSTSKGLARILRDESDRGVVIILTSFLEDAMADRLLRKLGVKEAAKRRSATRTSGPLGTFQSIVNLTEVAGMFKTKAHADVLDTLKAIRNACAHSRREISFATPELQAAVRMSLEDPPGLEKAFSQIGREGYRALFIFMIAGLLSGLKRRRRKQRVGEDRDFQIIVDAINLMNEPQASPKKPRRPAR